MPLKQLHVIKKLKFLVASGSRTKKQILNKVENDAEEHRSLNRREEKEDDTRVDRAR
jgi:hypothetical protein